MTECYVSNILRPTILSLFPPQLTILFKRKVHIQFVVYRAALHSKTWKKILIQHNRMKNPQLAGGNQLDIYKRGQGFELGNDREQIQMWSERDSNQGPPHCAPDALTTRPDSLTFNITNPILPWRRWFDCECEEGSRRGNCGCPGRTLSKVHVILHL